MRFESVDGELHVVLPDGKGTVPYDYYLWWKAAHRRCCAACPVRRLLRAAALLPLLPEK